LLGCEGAGVQGCEGLRARELGGWGARVPRSDRVKEAGQSPLGRILDLDLQRDFPDGDADTSE